MAEPLGEAFVRVRPATAGFREDAVRQIRPQLAGVAGETARLGAASRGSTRDLDRFGRGMIASSGAAASLGKSVAFASTAFLGGAGLGAAISSTVGSIAGFERNLDRLEVVSNATASQIAAFGTEAKRLGADLTLPSTSASDAAEAMTALAKGGLSVTDTLAASRGVIQLSTAAQIDNAAAATVTARALQAFQLEGREAGRVADVLANAANISTGEIGDMAAALQQSSAVARAAGLGLEDTATAITLLANAGIVGSDAGTSLKTMIQRLVPVAAGARRKMRELGIEFQDQAGNLLPLPRILDSYRAALSTLTPVARQQALLTIFGTDAIRAATILTEQGGQVFEETRAKIARSGTAARIAAAETRGLAGAWDGLKSNVQTAAIELGERALPALTAGVRAAAEGITSLAGSDDVAETFSALGAVARALAPALVLAGRAAAAVVDSVGATSLLAAIAVYKGLGLAVRGAAVAQAFYRRAVVASAATSSAATVAARRNAAAQAATAGGTATAASAQNAYTVAVARSIPATRGATAASTLFATSLTGVAGAAGAATAGTVAYGAASSVLALRIPVAAAGNTALAGSLTKIGGTSTAATTGIRAFARGAGSLALGAAGGPVGLAVIGVAGLAAGIVALSRQESTWERRNDDLRGSLRLLDGELARSRDLRRELGDATRAIASDEIALQGARLGVRRAQEDLATSTAVPGSLRHAEAVLALVDAKDRLSQVEVQLRADQARAEAAERGQIAAAAIRAANIREQVGDIQALVDAKRTQAQVEQGIAGKAGRRGGSVDETQLRIVRGVAAAFEDNAAALQKTSPAAARASTALATLTRAISDVPDQKQIDIILSSAAAGRTLEQILEDLGFTLEQAKQLATKQGLATGAAFGIGMVDGVLSSGPSFLSAIDALIQSATPASPQGPDIVSGWARAAREAAANAKAELASAKETLRIRVNTRAEAEKTALAAREAAASARIEVADAQQALRDAHQAVADTIRNGQRAVADAITQAKQNLSQIAQSLARTLEDVGGSAGRTGPLSKRFRELREQIIRGQGGPETQRAAQEIATRIQAQQGASGGGGVEQQFADLSTLLNRGSISVRQFNTRANAIIAQSGATAAKIQREHGVAAAEEFRAQLRGLREQAAAIAAGPRQPGAGFEISIVRPIETLEQTQRDLAAAQRSILQRQLDVQNAQRQAQTREIEETKAVKLELRALRREEAARERVRAARAAREEAPQGEGKSSKTARKNASVGANPP